MEERERQKLIEKLRTAKTNEERDRILRDLANRDRVIPGEPQGAEAAGVVKPAAEEPEGQAQGYVPPWTRIVILSMMASCGMLFIVDAVTTIMKGRYGSFEITTLIQGCVFLFAVLFVIFNGKLLARKDSEGGGRKQGSVDGEAATGEAAGPMQERVAPEMRVAIIVLLTIAGLGSMVWSMLRVMRSRWDGGDMWILIQGCALLYYAIHLFLKGKRDREKAGQGD